MPRKEFLDFLRKSPVLSGIDVKEKYYGPLTFCKNSMPEKKSGL